VDFFGRKASTYKSIGLLAMQHGVPVVVGCARRVSPKFQYEIRVNRIIEPGEWSDRPDPLEWITQEYTRALEDLVREAPEQYLWIHRRWKSRPKAELAAAAATA
jgi:KDO2-lipid IV(A) lauroyltransferase